MKSCLNRSFVPKNSTIEMSIKLQRQNEHKTILHGLNVLKTSSDKNWSNK